MEATYKDSRIIFADSKGEIQYHGRAKGRIAEFKEELREVQTNTTLESQARKQVVEILTIDINIAITSFAEDTERVVQNVGWKL